MLLVRNIDSANEIRSIDVGRLEADQNNLDRERNGPGAGEGRTCHWRPGVGTLSLRQS